MGGAFYLTPNIVYLHINKHCQKQDNIYLWDMMSTNCPFLTLCVYNACNYIQNGRYTKVIQGDRGHGVQTDFDVPGPLQHSPCTGIGQFSL